MPSVRVAVRCVFLAIFAGVFGYAGLSTGTLEQYFGIAMAGDPEGERPDQVAMATLAPFALDAALTVKPTRRADIVIVSRPQPVPDRLHHSILAYVAERNPRASLRTFRHYPAVVLAEAARTNIDHCAPCQKACSPRPFRTGPS